MTCEYANNCTPTHTLPFTGFEVVFLVGLAVAIVSAGLLLRFSRGDASDV